MWVRRSLIVAGPSRDIYVNQIISHGQGKGEDEGEDALRRNTTRIVHFCQRFSFFGLGLMSPRGAVSDSSYNIRLREGVARPPLFP